MLLQPRYKNWEQPTGHGRYHPEILVSPKLVELNGGLPEVDYDNLRRLNDELHVPPNKWPTYTLIHDSHVKVPDEYQGIDRYALRLGRTMFINTYSTDEVLPGQVDSVQTMERLIRRTAVYGLAENKQTADMTGREMVLGALTYCEASAATLCLYAGALRPAGLLGLGIMFSGGALAESRGAKNNAKVRPTVNHLLPQHANDIVFANLSQPTEAVSGN